MNLSRKNQRSIKRLRKDATKLWAEQQAVNQHAAEVFGTAKRNAVTLSQTELVPALKGSYDQRVRPSFDRGVAVARDAAGDARIRFEGKVLPTIATLLGTVAGGLATAAKNESLPQQLRSLDLAGTAKSARETSKELEKRAKAAMKEYDRKQGSQGIGVGGWVLVGTGAAALAAIGYALWQTFRADDDLWIADDELDAPITTVKPKEGTPAAAAAAPSSAEGVSTLDRAAEQGIATSDVEARHVADAADDSASSMGR